MSEIQAFFRTRLVSALIHGMYEHCNSSLFLKYIRENKIQSMLQLFPYHMSK